MRKLFVYGVALCIAGFFLSCTNAQVYEKSVKQLDSLEGAMSLAYKEMLNTDTVQLQKAIERYTTYRLFIKTQANDTLSPTEAETIQRFFLSGTTLVVYSKNRTTLLQRARWIHVQINKLRNDCRKFLISEQDLPRALELEQMAGNELSSVMLEQQKKYQGALQEFKQVMPLTEAFIRKHNNNELPQLVVEREEF